MRLKKNGFIHSRWEDEKLLCALVKYAAEDAFASIELFKVFVNHLNPGRLNIPMRPIYWGEFLDENIVDVRYSFKKTLNCKPNKYEIQKQTIDDMKQQIALNNKEIGNLDQRIEDMNQRMSLHRSAHIESDKEMNHLIEYLSKRNFDMDRRISDLHWRIVDMDHHIAYQRILLVFHFIFLICFFYYYYYYYPSSMHVERKCPLARYGISWW